MQILVIYEHHHLEKQLVLAIVLSSVAVALIFLSIFVVWIFWRRNQNDPEKKTAQGSDTSRGITLGPILSKFSSFNTAGRKPSLAMVEYSLLESATNNFSESNILGEGGFGFVYKACFDGGFLAAVKKLNGGRQDCEREFENEVNLLGKIQHPNIISLLGYCLHGEMRFLVYELMHNGSLETQLHGPSHGSALTWHIRMKIALDAARGLEYLHEHCNPPVIHRDLKSSNILLDSEFNAKISDFGLAVTGGNENKGNIKLSGTLGYVAPEYLLDGKLTEKSDVYAFGVVLLELLMGRKPVEKLAPSQCRTIVTWAMPQLTDRSKLPNIVDPAIKNTMDLKHLYQVAAVAVLCVQPEPSYRPLITDVLHSLIPLVPVELGGTLRVSDPSRSPKVEF
ncbi:probable receptor-like protein kinase At1g80640 [Asparagus officinalis]|nr:probable receptor-like protein kinase At1g80640 [Asparagus officinalis]